MAAIVQPQSPAEITFSLTAKKDGFFIGTTNIQVTEVRKLFRGFLINVEKLLSVTGSLSISFKGERRQFNQQNVSPVIKVLVDLADKYFTLKTQKRMLADDLPHFSKTQPEILVVEKEGITQTEKEIEGAKRALVEAQVKSRITVNF